MEGSDCLPATSCEENPMIPNADLTLLFRLEHGHADGTLTQWSRCITTPPSTTPSAPG